MQLVQRGILTGYRGKCFPVSTGKLAENCSGPCREVVENPSLQIFENQVAALKNQVWR